MAYPLVGLFLKTREEYPDFPPEFAEHVGWLCLGFVVLILLFSWTRAQSVRRALLALEDPRVWAVLRIGFGLMTLFCFLNLAPYWRMLWSDEGIFDLAYAQDRLGRTALRGWTPEDGFFDFWAILNFLWNKPSLFYLKGSPDFVFGYMMVFFGVLMLYTLGVFSRVTGVIAWLMMSGIYNRNALYWEGTDTVYRAFWFILLFARTGHAWSFDNWWRCRRLRKQGRLEDPAKPFDEDDRGAKVRREPIYRLVPAWPRYLFMLQLAAIYITTGAVKTGSVWYAGDALYYALNMDHFYRFEDITQMVSAVFGVNLFRTMTWVTHWWERFFPLALIGVSLGFTLRHRGQPWYERQNVWWRKWLGRLALLAAYALLYRIVVLAVPFCMQMRGDQLPDPTVQLYLVHAAFAVVMPAFAVAWFVLGRWPIRLFTGGRSLGKLTRRWPWARLPEVVIDQESLRAWLLGRRVWLTLGLIFHGFLAAFMNIGMFPFIMMMTYAAWVRGEEWVRFFRRCLAWARRSPKLSRRIPEGADRVLIDAQDAREVPVRGRTVPDVVVLGFGLAGVWLVFGQVEKAPWVGEATWWWLGAAALVALVFRLLPPSARDRARADEPGPALAYGSLGRALALFAVVWHATAVGFHLFPSYSLFNKWRVQGRAVFGQWLTGTGTTQGWRMFAPNPPRANSFMQTLVVLENGDVYDLKANAFEDRPNPWIINDRMRKMQRRMIGKGKWYLRYWADFQCREWALRHDGEVPDRIEIKKLVTRIPPPELVNVWQPSKFKGRKDPRSGAISGQPYVPSELKVYDYDVEEHDCRGDGELPLFMKERHGLPLTQADRDRAERDAQQRERKFERRKEQWEKRKDWRWFDDEDDEEKKKREHNARSLRPSYKKTGNVVEDDPEDDADGE